jgi:predicted RND superfamily exporter protein
MVPMLPERPWDAARLAAFRGFCLEHPLIRNVIVAADGGRTMITATFAGRAATAAAQRRFRERIDALLAPFRAEGLSLRVLGLPLIEEEIRTTLRHDLLRFLPAALGVVVGVLWLALRSLRLVGLALANQALVLLLLPGIVEAAGMELNVFSTLLAPLVTGMHLTLVMHLFTAVQRAEQAGHPPLVAIREAVTEVWKPAAISLASTGIGLLSLTVGSLPQMRDFGWLGALCLAVVAGFSFGPGLALLAVFTPQRAGAGTGPPAGGSPGAGWGGLVAWVIRHRRWVMAGSLLATVVAVAGLSRLRTDVRIIEMLGAGSPTRQALVELDQAYGGINVVQVEFDSGRTNGVNDPAFLQHLDAVHHAVAARPEPSGVYSYAQLLAIVNQIWEGGRADALRLPESPWLLGLFTRAIRAYRFPFMEALVDPTFRTAQLVVRTRDLPARDYLRMVEGIVERASQGSPPGVSVSAARGLHSILEADRRLLRSQAASAGLAAVAIGGVLALLWRSVRLALVAVVTNLVPVGLVLAGAGFAGIPLNSITVMVGAIALGVVEDDTVHFLTCWRERRAAGVPVALALRETLEVKGRPILWTTVVLVGVFALFALSSFPPVVHFGLLLAGAFVVAQLTLLAVLPAWLGRSLTPSNPPRAVRPG